MSMTNPNILQLLEKGDVFVIKAELPLVDYAVIGGYVNDHLAAQHGSFKGGGIVFKLRFLLAEQRVIKRLNLSGGNRGDLAVHVLSEIGD